MRYRTAVKTGRAALQVQIRGEGAFSQYAAFVDRLSAGYLSPLHLRLRARKNRGQSPKP
jgi:hypothetical protein